MSFYFKIFQFSAKNITLNDAALNLMLWRIEALLRGWRVMSFCRCSSIVSENIALNATNVTVIADA
jgi:hypothetical protein